MFGCGSKTKDVRLSEKEMKQLVNNISRSERKDFERRQKQKADDDFFDKLLFAEMFCDD